MKFPLAGRFLLLASFAFAQASAAPAAALIADMQKWVATLDATWQETYAREVTAPFDAEMAKLAQQYFAAVDANGQKASTSGNLDQTVLWRAERERFALAKDVPAEDEATAPVALKQLRTGWRTQAARLQNDRGTRATAVLARYDAVLAQAQKALTQQQRIDEALLLKKQREEVAARWSSAPVANTKPPGALSVAAPPAPRPKLAPREAVDQLLKAGEEVHVAGDRTRGGIRSVGDLPENFTVLEVDFAKEGMAGADAAVALLSNLPTIETVSLRNVPVTDAGLESLGALGSLKWLKLERLDKVSGAGWKMLAQLPSETLMLNGLPAGEEAIVAAAGNKRLNALEVDAIPTSDATLSALAANSTITRITLRARAELSPAGPALLARMRKLTQISLDEQIIDDNMAAELAKIGNLEDLFIFHPKLTAAGIASLASLPNLSRLRVNNPPVTPAALGAFKSLRKLKTLWVGNKTPAEDVAKLKAALPDVDVKV